MSRIRKVALLATVAAALSAFAAAFAVATTTQTFANTVQVTGAKHGTPTKPRSVLFNTFINSRQTQSGSIPSASKHTVIRFSKYFKFHGELFTTCTQQGATAGTCPPASKVGVGKAQATTKTGQVL